MGGAALGERAQETTILRTRTLGLEHDLVPVLDAVRRVLDHDRGHRGALEHSVALRRQRDAAASAQGQQRVERPVRRELGRGRVERGPGAVDGQRDREGVLAIGGRM